MIDAGFSEADIATLEQTMQYQAASKAKNNTAVRDYAFYALRLLRANTKIKTAVDSKSEYDRVKNLSYTLFGGFGPGQIRYLLRFADAETIAQTMYRLRDESWARGWLRTRSAILSLARAA
jgi:hypothetical protein